MNLRKFRAEPVTVEDGEPDDYNPAVDPDLYKGACRCGARWQGELISHCASCHLTFTSVTGFDDHRTGSHALDTRVCRSEAEMRSRGYQPNDAGQWRQPLEGPLHHWDLSD